MAKIINIGNQSNDGTGDSIRDAFNKVNENFNELYGIAGLSNGLFFTKLKDTPKILTASTASSPSVLVVDSFGNTLTNKILSAGAGISIANSGTYLTISSLFSSLSADPNPTLSNNLNGQNLYRGVNFLDPVNPQDLATKYYADNNSPFSRVNLYVSLNGRDSFGSDVPTYKQGRSLAYAFRTINYACQVAEKLITTSTVELSTYQQNLTLDSYNTTATVGYTESSTSIAGNTTVYLNYGATQGTDQFIEKDVRPGQYLLGQLSGTIGFIEELGHKTIGTDNFEFYDVKIRSGIGFSVGEPLLFAYEIPHNHITLFVESGIYEEQLPIRVPTNVSIRGDEFRRCIIKPAPGTSTSPWARIWFRRDDEFDGLTRASKTGRTGLAPIGQPFGYHYLTDPSNINSTPRLNADMDVFLMNDASILRAISCHGFGGFMAVLDPEGQILTKSPYIQNCASLSSTINEQVFAGGIYVDGFVGNLQAAAVDAVTYYTGTTSINVEGLTYRNPQVPNAFYNLGNRYEIDYFITGTTFGTGNIILNPRSPGGIAFPNGVIPINSGTGYSYAPIVLFDQPTTNGGFPAQGVANLSGGVLQSITVTNPGSGYTGTVQVQFIGGNPITPAGTYTIPSGNIKIGYIGVLPEVIEIGTAGNKSILSADFTQVNDLGYGLVGTNGGKLECVSDFTYYARAGYYTKNGALIRSLNGSCAYGQLALKSEGALPTEVPIPVFLDNDMVQTATVVSGIVGGINTVNTAGSTSIFIKDYTYIPYNQSEIEIDHGYQLDAVGNVLGLQTYNVVSASTVTNTAVPGLLELTLSNANIFGGISGGLKAPVSSGTQVTLRGVDVFKFKGINNNAAYSGAPALQFRESTATTYHILGFDFSNVAPGDCKITLREDFDYVKLQTYNTSTAAGTSTIAVYDLDAHSAARLNAQTARTDTQFTFAWHGGIYRITNYISSSTGGASYGKIEISPTLGSTITNVAGATSVQLKAGLRTYTFADVTRNIALLRATNHDMINIGAGSFYQSRYPNDIFGPPLTTPSSTYERIEVGTGRVFAVTNDQDGNFKVGDYFQVNQASGDLTIKASLSLTQVSGLGFKRGVVVNEFSPDPLMLEASGSVVPTQNAVIGYINGRLGLNPIGTIDGVTDIGPGYLDLTGVQAMKSSINMNNNKIINLTTNTNNLDAANKGYVDTKISLAGISAIDPQTGSTNSNFGIMTGALHLFRDPVAATDDGSTAATIRYVDKARQLSALSDVNLTSPSEQQLLMFTSSVLSLNTASSKPIWNPTNQIINVGLDTVHSDVQFNRTGNSLTIGIQTGTIWDNMISSTASIAQSKLNMQSAITLSSSTGIAQANLGLAAFDNTFFNTVNGFISLANSQSFPINAQTASKVDYTLSTTGTYLIGNPFDGSTSQTWSINGTSTNTANTLVARDGNGNVTLGNINGTVSQANSLQVNGTGQYFTATTATISNTIVSRDSNGNVWGNYFIGTSTNAWYADLAENYQADAAYKPGTVVIFGGDYEVTMSTEIQDTRVAGVISSNPAYLMNMGLEGPNVVPVAFTGRVPTQIVGPCAKGDLMVTSAVGGAATSIKNITSGTPAAPGSIIGKALQAFNGTMSEQAVIEVVVGRY